MDPLLNKLIGDYDDMIQESSSEIYYFFFAANYQGDDKPGCSILRHKKETYGGKNRYSRRWAEGNQDRNKILAKYNDGTYTYKTQGS